MPNATLAIIALAGVLAASQSLSSEVVKLSSPGGGVEVSGRLLGYDGETYRIDTVYGVLTVSADGTDCVGAACPDPGPYVAELMVSGAAGTNTGVVPALLEAFAVERGLAFMRQEEDATHFLYVLSAAEGGGDIARVRFRVTESAEGFADLLTEAANIALAFSEPTAAERDRALEAGLGDLWEDRRSGVLALDALVSIVAPGNPLGEISQPDLARVLRGEVLSWAALGGPDEPIALHLPTTGSALSERISDSLLGGAAVPGEGANRHQDLSDLDSAVEADPLALGVTSFSSSSLSKRLGISGSCGAVIAPEPFTIKTKDYPLTVPQLAFTTDLTAPRFLGEFLAYTRSSLAQEAIRAAGFVDLAIDSRPLARQGDRLVRAILGTGSDVTAPDLRAMIRALDGAVQTSLTFRFKDGSADLDVQSRKSVTLLSEAILKGEFDSGDLIFAGFSDSQGSGETNRDLSLRRAEAVIAALRTELGEAPEPLFDAMSFGFGEALPIACDDDAWGRETNRRVEVWFRRAQP
ncbi:MAG: phosphate ABC transporter substrate-binding/OmpA family protein [Pseudomonadota bacterium]